MRRAVVFVDGQNLRFQLQAINLQEKDVNWGKLFTALTPQDHYLVRAYWYQAAKIAPWQWNANHHGQQCPQGMSAQAFEQDATKYYEDERARLEHIHRQVYERLERTYDSIEFRYSGVLKVDPTYVSRDPKTGNHRIGKRVGEKGVDVALAVDMVRHVDAYDTAIVVSGDFDFLPAIQAVKDRLKRVAIVSVMQGTPPKHQGQAHGLRSLCDTQIEVYESDLKDKNKYGA